MDEYSRILIEEYCRNNDTAKSKRLYRLVRKSYDLSCSKCKDEKYEEGIILFGTKTCPNCKAAGKLLEKANIEYKFIDAEDNVELTKKYSVKQAPTLVVVTKNNIDNIVNLSNIKKFMEEYKK